MLRARTGPTRPRRAVAPITPQHRYVDSELPTEETKREEISSHNYLRWLKQNQSTSAIEAAIPEILKVIRKDEYPLSKASQIIMSSLNIERYDSWKVSYIIKSIVSNFPEVSASDEFKCMLLRLVKSDINHVGMHTACKSVIVFSSGIDINTTLTIHEETAAMIAGDEIYKSANALIVFTELLSRFPVDLTISDSMRNTVLDHAYEALRTKTTPEIRHAMHHFQNVIAHQPHGEDAEMYIAHFKRQLGYTTGEVAPEVDDIRPDSICATVMNHILSPVETLVTIYDMLPPILLIGVDVTNDEAI